MKIIFLDIDGVLNNDRWASVLNHLYGGNGYGGFVKRNLKRRNIKWDYYNVDNLKTLMDKTGAKIVISSTWRYSHSINDFKVMFQLYGLEPRIVDITPDLSKTGITDLYIRKIRGDEINAWLDDHPDITNYVILDDDSDFHPGQPLVRTDPEYGLTDQKM